MPSANKLEIELKKARQVAYDLRIKLNKTENQLAAAELAMRSQLQTFQTVLQENESLKKEIVRLKRQPRKQVDEETNDT